MNEDEDAEVQYRSVQAKECVLKEMKGTREIHFGGSSNHTMVSDFIVSSRSNKTRMVDVIGKRLVGPGCFITWIRQII